LTEVEVEAEGAVLGEADLAVVVVAMTVVVALVVVQYLTSLKTEEEQQRTEAVRRVFGSVQATQ
jgi:uncharacterized PurR-regulated membrane protein YhhQ (DUF165 family)